MGVVLFAGLGEGTGSAVYWSPAGKAKLLKYIGGRVAKLCFQRVTVVAGPDLMQSGLDYGEEIPAAGGENVDSAAEKLIRCLVVRFAPGHPCGHRRQ